MVNIAEQRCAIADRTGIGERLGEELGGVHLCDAAAWACGFGVLGLGLGLTSMAVSCWLVQRRGGHLKASLADGIQMRLAPPQLVDSAANNVPAHGEDVELM